MQPRVGSCADYAQPLEHCNNFQSNKSNNLVMENPTQIWCGVWFDIGAGWWKYLRVGFLCGLSNTLCTRRRGFVTLGDQRIGYTLEGQSFRFPHPKHSIKEFLLVRGIGSEHQSPRSQHHLKADEKTTFRNTPERNYSTVTDLAKFLGLSTSVPRAQAV